MAIIKSRDERTALGKAARTRTPLTEQAHYTPAADRPDPVGLLEQQAATRVPELLPIRYGRMLTSPFAFYRGAAVVMATDLGAGPSSGLSAQLCGDAHLSNFGVFGSPERHLVFDVNDFDETLPGPFEWDVKRLTTSLEIAGRANGLTAKDRRKVLVSAAAAYRQAMRDFATQPNLAVWYAQADTDELMARFGPQLDPVRRKRTEAELAKARTRDSLQAFSKLTTIKDGRPTLVSDPPLIVPVEELLPEVDAADLYKAIRGLVRTYQRSLAQDRRALLQQYELVHMARKVVGVGSVGTRAWILLLQGVDSGDPLLLQAKEAQASVLQPVTGGSRIANQGQRVVIGQRLMQASADIFLGWQRNAELDGVSRDYYLRQLRDWKGSVTVEELVPGVMDAYAQLCGWTLARAHARSGDRIALAAYLGGKDTFDQAIADFAVAYADQNERDYAALRDAVRTGRIKATTGV